MKTYLLDASAAIEIYLADKQNTGQIMRHVLGEQERKSATLFIPNFCVAEVFNCFARKHFRENGMSTDTYKEYLDRFRGDIHWGKTIYSYDLNRYHIVAADNIIPAEQKRELKAGKGPLSTFDILIIAMACELAYTRGVSNTFLLTRDERLNEVCNDIRKNSFQTPKGPLGELHRDRWPAPRSFYLDKMTIEDFISETQMDNG